jgi:hypothetical protein
VLAQNSLDLTRTRRARALTGAHESMKDGGQKFTMMFSKSRWQQPKDLWSSPRKVIATASGLIVIVGAVVAIMRWIAVATSGA